MSNPSPLASFHATDLELRRGRRLIWEDASWTVQGATTVVGANGQGKSSTLRMLAGQLTPTSGTLSFRAADGEVSVEAWMTRCSVAAPWLNLPGHLTLDEAMSFHGVYRTPRPGPLHWAALVQASGLRVDPSLPVSQWSSGQQQRLMLALALGTEADAVLLDEPASNLDEVGIQWMKAQMTAVQALSTVVVATNDEKKEGLKGASLLRIG
ncbi:MAG TPA: ABC transporter ATP-binding protein [Flavobacteriales bacterium]|nr:ABC transporter ATP-binding protein [Flavobacteriales bacterium]